MFKAFAFRESLVHIWRQHVVHPFVHRLKQHIHCVTRTAGAEKLLDGVKIRVVRALMKELHELGERLVDKHQVAQRHGHQPVRRNRIKSELDSLPWGAVFFHNVLCHFLFIFFTTMKVTLRITNQIPVMVAINGPVTG